MKVDQKSKKLVGTLIIGMVIAFTFGCADKEPKSNPFFEEWKNRAERSQAVTPTKESLMEDQKEKQAAAKKKPRARARPLPRKRVTVRIRDIEVGVALHALARIVNQNILINQGIQGKITIDVDRVPWNEVFTGILKAQGLDYAWEGRILRIMTWKEMELENKRQIMTRIIRIEYADAVQLKENLASILMAQMLNESRGRRDPNELTAEVQSEISAVMVDEYNNALIIQATKEELDRLSALVADLDRPNSQVRIEAHIVETTSDTARNLGVMWGGLGRDGNQTIFSGNNPTTFLPGGPSTDFASDFPATDVDSTFGLSLGYLVGSLGGNLLAAELSALQEDGLLNILSSPSITTIDNQLAMIESGQEVPFQAIDDDGDIEIEFKKATLKLEVTPRVIGDKYLKLDIKTQKDELDFSRADQLLGYPIIITKNASTQVVLRDGQTTVIGGLNKEQNTDRNAGVPGLKDVPILGWLFKKDTKGREMEELLIFITPHILKGDKFPGAGDVDDKTVHNLSETDDSLMETDERFMEIEDKSTAETVVGLD